jgi:hypothetical protein
MKSIVRNLFLLASACAALADPAPPAPAPSDPAPTILPQTGPIPPPPAIQKSGIPWLGFDLSKPDETTTAQLPSLPKGIGFVVKSIDTDSPAATSGIQPLDVIWKFGDQLLVNEGQLITLLRLHKPGETVKLSLFRAGKHVESELILGELPLGRRHPQNELIDAAIMPGGGARMINLANRTATFSNDEGRAVLRRSEDGESYDLTIHDPEDKLIFEGNVNEHGDAEGIPTEWRRRVCALRRGLDHALEGRMVPVRQPRPRVVPAPLPTDK